MNRRKRLGEMLVEAGVIDPTSLTAALAHQRQWGVRLGQALVELRIVTEKDIVHALSRKLGLEVAVIDGLAGPEHEAALKLIPRDFAVKNNVLPMNDDGNTLTVAMSDPVNVTVIDDLAFRSGRRVKVTIAGDQEVGRALRRVYPAQASDKVEAIAFDDDPSDTGIMPLVGQEHLHEGSGADAEWRRREASRDRRTQAVKPARTETRAPDPRRDMLGSVPATGFEVDKTAEMALTGDYPLGAEGEPEPELLPEDALEPMGTPPGIELPGRPVEARPPPGPRLPARSAQVMARLAARGAKDPELADAARVLAAVLRALLAKGVITDDEIAAELRKLSGEPEGPGSGS